MVSLRSQWRSCTFSLTLSSQRRLDYPFIFESQSLISDVTLFKCCGGIGRVTATIVFALSVNGYETELNCSIFLLALTNKAR